MKIILITCTNHIQYFNVVACFLLELLGHQWLLLYLFLNFCVVLRTLIKTEQTIEKSPNFAKVFLNIWTSFSQNFNDVALFLLELLGFVFYIYTIFLCSFQKLIKNRTNNWKITKLSANTFEHSNKLQPKLQWCSFIRSWVIRLCFLYIYYIFMLFQKLIKTEQTIEKLWKFQQILLNTWTSFSQNFNGVASFVLELLGIVIYILYFYPVGKKTSISVLKMS